MDEWGGRWMRVQCVREAAIAGELLLPRLFPFLPLPLVVLVPLRSPLFLSSPSRSIRGGRYAPHNLPSGGLLGHRTCIAQKNSPPRLFRAQFAPRSPRPSPRVRPSRGSAAGILSPHTDLRTKPGKGGQGISAS